MSDKLEKSDVKEIRKAVKSKETVVDWIYGLYVNAENEPVLESVDRLIEMEDAERFRYMNLFGKVLSPHLGRDSFPMVLSGQNDMLLELRTEKKEAADFQEFRDLLLDSYLHTDPYYATVARVVYDIPVKTKDKQKLDDSEYVYESLLFSICPAKLSTPALGLKEDHIAELDRRWVIGSPKSGFLYPAFDNRAEDRNQVLIRSASPDNEDFLKVLFEPAGGISPVGAKEQKDLFSSLMEGLGVSLTDAAAISETILEKASQDDAPEVLTGKELKIIAEDSGVNTENFDELYEDTIGAVPLSTAAIVENYVTVKTDSAFVRLPSDKAELIKTQVIDGREYILIPSDGAVSVNGIPVSASHQHDGGRHLAETGQGEESASVPADADRMSDPYEDDSKLYDEILSVEEKHTDEDRDEHTF